MLRSGRSRPVWRFRTFHSSERPVRPEISSMIASNSAHRLRSMFLAGVLSAGLAVPAFAQAGPSAPPAPPVHANWLLANRYSNTALRNVVFGTSVQPRWIGKTDSMFYNWKSRNGSQFTLVVPMTTTRRPLFDHEKLAVALAMSTRKPIEATNLPFTTINFTRDHKSIRFAFDSTRYEWVLATETLKSLGKVLRDSVPQDLAEALQCLGGEHPFV